VCLSSRWILTGRRNRSLFWSFVAGETGAVVNRSTADVEFDGGIGDVLESNENCACVGVDIGVGSSSSAPYDAMMFWFAAWEWKEEESNVGSDGEGLTVSSRLYSGRGRSWLESTEKGLCDSDWVRVRG